MVEVDKEHQEHQKKCLMTSTFIECNFSKDTLGEDVSLIRRLLHFKTQDDRRSSESSNRTNYSALQRVWTLPNLQGLEILTGDVGKGWGTNRELIFLNAVKARKKFDSCKKFLLGSSELQRGCRVVLTSSQTDPEIL